GRVLLSRLPSIGPAGLTAFRGLMLRGGQPRRRGRAWQSPPPPTGLTISSPFRGLMVHRPGEERARLRNGWLLRFTPAPLGGIQAPLIQVKYHVYSNTGTGDPINYTVPIATTARLTYLTSPLSYPGTWSFGVRAFDQFGEEQNLDCAVTIILDGSGNDITLRPSAPTGLRALAMVAGAIRVEWAYLVINRATVPTGFNVYIGTGGVVNYATPVAIVSYASGIANTFVANLMGLTSGTVYSIAVRAFNAIAQEPNTIV